MPNKIRRYLSSDFWRLGISKYFFKPMQFMSNTLFPIFQDITEPAKYFLSKKKHNNDYGIFSIANSTYCNGRCVFCPYNKLKFKGTLMEKEVFKRAVDEIEALGIRRISLGGIVGEAILDPDFFNKVDYIKKKGMTLIIGTNALYLGTNNNYKKLVESGIDEVYVSLSDLDPKIEAQVYGISEEMAERKIKGMIDLIKYNRIRKGIKIIGLGFRPSRNPHEILKNESSRIIDKSIKYEFIFGFDNWCGLITKEDMIGSMRLRRARIWKRKPCNLLNNFTILPNGDVRMCICRFYKDFNDELVIGNIKDKHLKDILIPERINEIKKKFINDELPKVCQNCTFYC